MTDFFQPVVLGITLGFVARFYMLRVDYRMYPTFPHGYQIHLSLGLIAAALGAVAIPALKTKDYAAVTFLALAAQQFRDIRNMERNSLVSLEPLELVGRGAAYIEGIAKVFEARNYLAMLTALITSGIALYINGWAALLIGIAAIILSSKLMKGEIVGEIAKVESGELYFEGADLFVSGVQIMNVGLKASREMIRENGLGVVIEPKDDNARETLGMIGQRQAIIHTAAAILGVRKDTDTQEFTPLIRRNINTGRIVMVIVPVEKDIEALIESVNRTPVLENNKRCPLKTQAGRIAED